MQPLGMSQPKVDLLLTYQWGCPDETACDIAWTANLPGFALSTHLTDVPLRCIMAGKEIKDKMITRNGFTALKATALIGAHTIGSIRNTFRSGLALPWVNNRADTATPNGPVFDNGYHDFLDNTIVKTTPAGFQSNFLPFTTNFPTWFQDDPNGLNHLDTDIALAFPTGDATMHPNYHQFTLLFSSDPLFFLLAFLASYEKMSRLGVLVTLVDPIPCNGCFVANSTPTRRNLQKKTEKTKKASKLSPTESSGFSRAIADALAKGEMESQLDQKLHTDKILSFAIVVENAPILLTPAEELTFTQQLLQAVS